ANDRGGCHGRQPIPPNRIDVGALLFGIRFFRATVEIGALLAHFRAPPMLSFLARSAVFLRFFGNFGMQNRQEVARGILAFLRHFRLRKLLNTRRSTTTFCCAPTLDLRMVIWVNCPPPLHIDVQCTEIQVGVKPRLFATVLHVDVAHEHVLADAHVDALSGATRKQRKDFSHVLERLNSWFQSMAGFAPSCWQQLRSGEPVTRLLRSHYALDRSHGAVLPRRL
ncbi:MAG TPA: hypothetical protein VFZ59_09715, partial [Verrucomicrobiae bacterium]|nr:hypothetical protein [Verrucomicrobiae bacterium]